MPAFRAASRRLAPASTSISFFSLTNVTLGMSDGPSQGAGDQYQATSPSAGRSPALYEPPPPRATRPPATIRGGKARRAEGHGHSPGDAGRPAGPLQRRPRHRPGLRLAARRLV